MTVLTETPRDVERDLEAEAEARYFDLADPAYVNDLRGYNLEGDAPDPDEFYERGEWA